MSQGILTQISLAKETTWKTAVVPTKSMAVRPTGGLEIKNNVGMQPAVKGQLQKYYDAIKGNVSYEGNLSFDAFADYLGYFLLSALGTDTPAVHAGETIVYDHVFTETSPKPSMTIEQSQGESCRRFAGAICKELKITGKTGEMLQVEAAIVAGSQATSSAITAAFSTIPAFNFAQLQVKIGGSAIGEVESIELNYKNGIEMVYALGSNDPAYSAIKGGSEITGKIEMYLDAATLTRLTNAIAKTNEAIELIATGGAIGSAATYVLDITIPKAVYTASNLPITDDHNKLTIEFSGLYDTSTSKLLGVTLTNLVASY